MASSERHRLRHKGVETGPLAREELLGKLRDGLISQAHAIEVRGKWMTLRQHLLETSPAGAGGPTAERTGRGRIPAPPGAGGDQPPPPPGSPGQPPSLDAFVRAAYMWCGLTFGLPFLLAGLPWFFRDWLGLGGPAGSFVLLATALGTVAYAYWRARSLAATIEAEGVADLASSVRNLAAGLSLASALLWVVATLA